MHQTMLLGSISFLLCYSCSHRKHTVVSSMHFPQLTFFVYLTLRLTPTLNTGPSHWPATSQNRIYPFRSPANPGSFRGTMPAFGAAIAQTQGSKTRFMAFISFCITSFIPTLILLSLQRTSLPKTRDVCRNYHLFYLYMRDSIHRFFYHE